MLCFEDDGIPKRSPQGKSVEENVFDRREARLTIKGLNTHPKIV